MKKFLLTLLTIATLAFSGLMLQGCPQVAEDGTVEVVVPHVNTFANSAQTTAAVAKIWIGDDAPSVEAVLRNIATTIKGADGNVSALIMDTVDQAIESGALSPTYRTFILGIVGIADSYLQFADFNVDDVILIFEAAANGLSDQVSAQAAGFDW